MEIPHLFEEGGVNLRLLQEFIEDGVDFVAVGLSGIRFQRFVAT